MRRIFEQELEQIGSDLSEMGQLVAKAIEDATTALRDSDLELAQQVIADDAKIDALQRQLEEQCVSLLARQQPVATDLRVVISALRMSATVERMGDLARHVAIIARGRYPEAVTPEPLRGTLIAMAEAATRVGKQMITLMHDHDLALGAEIERNDTILDDLLRKVFEHVLDESIELSRQQVIDAVLLSRFLERLGDHGVSVAHRITFLVTGDFDGSAVLKEYDSLTGPTCPGHLG